MPNFTLEIQVLLIENLWRRGRELRDQSKIGVLDPTSLWNATEEWWAVQVLDLRAHPPNPEPVLDDEDNLSESLERQKLAATDLRKAPTPPPLPSVPCICTCQEKMRPKRPKATRLCRSV